ncbi:hypothetical protein [Sabulibacter ruber]|nr:hypothetical protein [Sabulibacter ruber]
MTKGDIDPPPFFKSWTAMYWLVIGVLAGLVGLFYLITIAYQ